MTTPCTHDDEHGRFCGACGMPLVVLTDPEHVLWVLRVIDANNEYLRRP